MKTDRPKDALAAGEGIGVYVHFPWCLQKCPYCDFATRPLDRPAIPHAAYADAVIAELSRRATLIEGATLRSVFFGGGTPSLWEPTELGRVLRAIENAFPKHASSIEITAECNPSSLDKDRARSLVDVGVHRLSVGIQSLDDGRLRFLGRLHDRAMALDALDAALRTAPRASADVIFGNPGQTAEAAAAEVDALLGTGLAHISAYSLTIEPSTRFGELHRKGKLPIALEDDVADSFLAVRDACAKRGLSHYEISNYAKPGQESAHNLHYWRGGDYLGLGAAAVGRIGARRYRNQPDPNAYTRAHTLAETEESEERLSLSDRVREALMLGLRTQEGVDLRRLSAWVGEEEIAQVRRAASPGLARGDLRAEGDRLVVPVERWLSLDAIVLAFF